MNNSHRYSRALKKLKSAGLRPTRQRLSLARLLFEVNNRHVTAEQLHNEAIETGIKVSLATVYNTLHQFTQAKLLREVVVESGRAHFDTNVLEHHHIFNRDTGILCDIPKDTLSVINMPETPEGTEIERMELIVRVKSR